MDIRSRLNLYTKPQAKPESVFIPEDIGCEAITTDAGTVYRRETKHMYADDYFGNIYGARDISVLMRHNGWNEEFTVDDLIFFDTETTSLSIAAGSIPFLCGISYTDGDSIITEQIFLDSPANESASLMYIMQFFQRAKAVVTFNGASFDMPLLKNRYRLNRVYGFPVKIPVIDLLKPARRIFKNLYDSVSLQSLEKHILGMIREGDIPGYLIPDVYFRFQHEGETEQLSTVIEHNRLDIISMLYLLDCFAEIYINIDNGNFSSIDRGRLKNVARHLFNSDINLFLDLADFLGDETAEDSNLFEKYSIALKRENEWEKAEKYWLGVANLYSFRELAKYYEHKKKDNIAAKKVCDDALELIKSGKYSKDVELLNPEYWLGNFAKRIERLGRKK